jgi:hypothetical protein
MPCGLREAMNRSLPMFLAEILAVMLFFLKG